MLLAMGIAAFLCVFIGIFPGTLYSILPYPVDFEPYTFAHVFDTLQLLLFAGLAAALLILSGLHPPELNAINLDTDWFYRKGANAFNWVVKRLTPVTAFIVIPLLGGAIISVIVGIY